MVRNRALHGLKFRRQHPLNRYIADFYCHELKLVIELDGRVHDLREVKERDLLKEEAIRKLGLTVIRFNNDIVFSDPDRIGGKVLEIKNGLTSSKPQ
jgi:very-short-patch-repair endonuclease